MPNQSAQTLLCDKLAEMETQIIDRPSQQLIDFLDPHELKLLQNQSPPTWAASGRLIEMGIQPHNPATRYQLDLEAGTLMVCVPW
jgi:hypothetical protein